MPRYLVPRRYVHYFWGTTWSLEVVYAVQFSMKFAAR